MTNPFTIQVESGLGAIFILVLSIFFIGILFITVKNYDSDTIALGATQTEVKSMSSTERQLIAHWIQDNNIPLPEGKGYRYILAQYPNRPWLAY